MTGFMKRAFQEGTQITRFNVLTAAIIGASAHFFFYFLFKYQYGLAENFALRMMAVATCISLLLINHLPEPAKRYLPFYWHAGIIFILPFIFTFNLLITDFHELWRYWTIFMVCVVIVYVPNLLMILLDLSLGVALAVAVFLMTATETELHADFEVSLFALVVVFTIISMYLFSRDVLKGVREQEYRKQEALRILAASIAHEMRNPLMQFRLNVESAARCLPAYFPGRPPEPMSERELEAVYRLLAHGRMAATRGAQVIDMLLDEVNDKPVDTQGFEILSAAQATRRAVEEYGYESSTERERVSLRLEEDFAFRGEETLLVFVLFNLLKNALYVLRSHPEGRIEIDLRSGGTGNRITFRDTGSGMSPDVVAQLFAPFYTKGKKGGTGLGLAYCKRVMVAFGGDIECVSEPGRFTEFTLTFPSVSEEALEAAVGIGRKGPDERFVGRSLLVVDDEPMQRSSAARLLRFQGAEVVEAGDGREALERLRERRFDLVLMDLNMPHMNGYETAEAIRAGEAGEAARSTPVVACTSEPEYIARGTTERVGMQGMLTKPCGEAQLVRKVAKLFDLVVEPLDSELSPSRIEQPGESDGEGTILLVDDSASMRQSLELYFLGQGFEVLQAGEGHEALEQLREHPCDLVLTDMNMPGMSGIELARRIRDHDDPAVAALPVVGLSGFSDAERQGAAREAGMDCLLDKGGDLGGMVETIRELLASRKGGVEAPEGFDPTAAARALGVSPNDLGEHLTGFLTEYRDHPQRLREAFDEGDWQEIRHLAHKLHGMAKLIRFNALAEAASSVEERGRERRGDGTAEAVERLAGVLEGLIQYIENSAPEKL